MGHPLALPDRGFLSYGQAAKLTYADSDSFTYNSRTLVSVNPIE